MFHCSFGLYATDGKPGLRKKSISEKACRKGARECAFPWQSWSHQNWFTWCGRIFLFFIGRVITVGHGRNSGKCSSDGIPSTSNSNQRLQQLERSSAIIMVVATMTQGAALFTQQWLSNDNCSNKNNRKVALTLGTHGIGMYKLCMDDNWQPSFWYHAGNGFTQEKEWMRQPYYFHQSFMDGRIVIFGVVNPFWLDQA